MFWLQFRNELWTLFAKKRTHIGFGMFALAQLIIVLIFRFTTASSAVHRDIRRIGLDDHKYFSALTLAATILLYLAYSLLPIYVALVGGDIVSKEAEDGTLRMLLSRPISRLRLLCLKWLAGFSYACVLVVALGGLTLFWTWLSFPRGGGMFVLVPNEGFGLFDLPAGLHQYLLGCLTMMAKAGTIMSLAFMFSCFNMKPASATIISLSLLIIDRILMELPYFQDLQPWFLGHYLNVWQTFLTGPAAAWRVGQALCVMFAATLTFFIVGAAAFQARDIKS